MQRSTIRILGFALFCLLLTGFAWYGVRWVENLPKKMMAASELALEKKALELRAKFFEMAHFQTRIRIRDRILENTNSEIAEIAILEKNIEMEREFVHSWAGSTKTLRLRGKYRVKVGFDVLDRFEIRVEKDRRSMSLPPARVLSVEQTEMHVEALENGYWNSISADDLQTTIAGLQEQARLQSSGLVKQAEKNFTTRIQQLVDPHLEFIRLDSRQP